VVCFRQAEVEEDFAHFNIKVTHKQADYDSHSGYKVRVALVNDAVGVLNSRILGIAYLKSVRLYDNVCWAKCRDATTTMDIISHEVGHVFGVDHDRNANTREEYFDGLPSNQGTELRWKSIMGYSGPYGITQW